MPMIPLVLAAFILAVASDTRAVLQTETAKYGQLHSVYPTNVGVFAISVSLRTFHVSWGSTQFTTLFCSVGEGIASTLIMDAQVVANTLYVLTSLDSSVVLWSFNVQDSYCKAAVQWSYTPKGRPVYGFVVTLGSASVIGMVDTKRDFILSAIAPDLTGTALPVPSWTQVRSLQAVDLDAGDATGTLSKAFPKHVYDVGNSLVVFLDKTGKGLHSNLHLLIAFSLHN